MAPAPMYESYKKVFEDALDNHDRQWLIAYKDRFNRGFEVPMDFKYEDKDYRLRMIILFDHGLFARKQKTLQNRIGKTQKAFEQISAKLNRYNLKSYDAIDKACSAILKNNHTKPFFSYQIINEPITTYKNKHRGRPLKKGDVVDTSGLVRWEVLNSVLPHTDLFLFDLKCFSARRHKALTGVDNELIKANLRRLLKRKAAVWIRIPLIAGCNDQPEEWEPAAEMIAGLNADSTVHLLPYHGFGEDKYARLGKAYQLPGAQAPSPSHLGSLYRIFQSKGMRVSVKGMENSEA